MIFINGSEPSSTAANLHAYRAGAFGRAENVVLWFAFWLPGNDGLSLSR
jgi:hypothetical protein